MRLRGLALTLALGLLAQAGDLRAFSVPAFSGPVVDQAGLLSKDQAEALAGRLSAIQQGGGAQIAVLISSGLDDLPIEEASMRVAEAWKMGRADADNGVLILLAPRERKVRIEVGQGLEGDLTDVFCSRVIRELMAPRLREGKPELALREAVDALASKAGGGEPLRAPAKRRGLGLGTLIALVVLFVVLRIVLGIVMPGALGWGGRRRRAWWEGDGPWRGHSGTAGRRSSGWGGGGSSSSGGGFSGGGGGGFSGGGASGGW